MKKILSIIAIAILLTSCKKESAPIKITAIGYCDIINGNNGNSYGYVNIQLSTTQKIKDTIFAVVALSIPSAGYEETDTCIITPNVSTWFNSTHKTGLFSDADIQTKILSVTSNGGYRFSY